jgi:predicted nucleotidyltransferase
MVDQSVVKTIQNYLRVVDQSGVPVRFGVLFGSYARGTTHQWSDIDLLVVSPAYDKELTHKKWGELWLMASRIDTRIEPIPCGEKQYKEDDSSMIIEMARREGQVIPLAE